MKEFEAPGCGREHELIAFLYGELSDIENKSFASHLEGCSLCQTQTSEFRSIRESVVAWRDNTLGRTAIAAPQTSAFSQPKTSALAALRAFFDLSPLWMKGAVGFAGILFFIFSVLAVVNLQPAPAISAINASSDSEAQRKLDALIEQRVQQEVAERLAAAAPPTVADATAAIINKTVRVGARRFANQANEVATNARNEKARRPLTKAEREELATDLRLVSAGNERGLDLVEDQINQP